ncbi:pyridoxal phosphate-dependent aminotransferase [Nereida sp. MMG025]|uniref:pyridoxal phosphate-dependent aminotransferase n=1 Tax=Nereida sp. MMG025 TaxID=2909981 RepID=UPI001EFF8B1C|nr:pyridoxal phosphate-dependent aminotransferase [Nereida sp. MMG025]MCF6445077.1 pyridoxal phosphate-dependent aminotransferase [Nereida sp. MMG025]
MTQYRFTDIAATLPSSVPFVGPETQERQLGRRFDARLGANESTFGPSPKAIAAMVQTAADIWQYADPENHDLRHALAAHHDVNAANVVVGEGIDGLLGYLVRLFVGAGDAVVTSLGAYPTFNYHVNGYGGTLHSVPYRDDYEDIDALWAKAEAVGAKLIYLANPDNPMGSHHSAATIENAISRLPKGVLLVLDEAYADTCADLPSIAIDTPNVIRMRTFSKAYGMAGARVGYALGPVDLINAFHKVRNHFGMNRAAQAGALAALQDQPYLHKTLEQIAASKARIAEISEAWGWRALSSATNFVAVDCGRDGAYAKRMLEALIQEGVFVRMPFAAPQNRCIRISCGTDAQMDLLEAALQRIKK